MSASVTAELITALRGLVELFSAGPVSIEEATRRVGVVEQGFGEATSMTLRPSVVGVQAAYLARNRDTGAAFSVTLELAEGVDLTADALAETFGSYERFPGGHEGPTEYVFSRQHAILLASSFDRESGRIRQIMVRAR